MSDPQGPSESLFQSLFDAALEEFEKQTGTSLARHPLALKLDACKTVESTIASLQEQAKAFRQFRGDDGKVSRCLKRVVHVLHKLSTTGVLGEGIGLPFPPAKAIFAGIGILLSAIEDVGASYDALGDLLESIENFLRRLDIYANIPPTPAMCEILVKILVELLSIFALATKEIKQGRLIKFGKKLLRESDVEAVLQRLDRLAANEARMAVAKTLEVVYGLVQNMSVDREDNGSSTVNVQEALAMVQKIAMEIKESRRRELRRWLSPPDPWKNYNIARETLCEGTGRWFTQSETFFKWKSSSLLLWIHGKPGSGKSVLSSAIIQDVEEMREDGSSSIAFFFFDFRDDEKQTRRNLLSSLLVQLCDQSDAHYDILFKFYSKFDHGSRPPSDKEVTHCLKEMLNAPRQDPIYFIIDALDECPRTFGIPSARENVLALVQELVDLRCPNLHICITSRPEPDIETILSRFAFSSVSLHSEDGQKQDIINYINHVVNSDPKMQKWRPEDKRLVIDTLSERADGMFRWVFCQLDWLRRCLPQRIRCALDELPETLDETYERTLQRIDEVNWGLAHRLFQCVAVALRPLCVEELAEFLALDFKTGSIPDFNPIWRPENPRDAVLSTCSSLLTVVDVGDSQVIQFSHYSVKEFLTSDRIAKAGVTVARFEVLMEPAHTALAQGCFAVLLKLSANSNRSTIGEVPLAHYASQHWVDHALLVKASRNIQDGMKRLFDPSKPHFAVWVWICDTILGSSLQTIIQNLSRLAQAPFNDDVFRDYLDMGVCAVSGRPLGKAAWLLLADRAYANARVKENWTPLCCESNDGQLGDARTQPNGVRGVNDWDTYDWTPLAWALENQCLEFVWVLLKYGSNSRARDGRKRTSLHWASEKGLLEICRVLLQRGAVADDRDKDNKTPLHWASMNGRLEVVQVLLSHQANVNSLDAHNKTPLHWASEHGHYDVAGVLLEHGADVDPCDNHTRTPLQWALENDHLQVVRVLLVHHAGVNSPGIRDMTPLHRVSENGHPEVARVLLEHGADVNSRDRYNRTPLHRASENGHHEVVGVLLQHGANVDPPQGYSKTPVQLALENGHPEVVRVLLAHNADLDFLGNDEKSPLYRASEDGHLEVVRVLLARGVDVNHLSSNFGTPLAAAAKNGHQKVVQLLLAHGANMGHPRDGTQAPLDIASENGQLEVVRLLLGHGAEVNPSSDEIRSPLSFASGNGHLQIAQLLLEHGARVNLSRRELMAPLDHASKNGHLEVTRLLLEHGAEVNFTRREFMTPLDHASRNGHTEVAQLLLERGAEVNVPRREFLGPLDHASRKGHTEVARLLLEHGAEVNFPGREFLTPLDHASMNGNLGVARLLLMHGAHFKFPGSKSPTPHRYASKNGHREVARLLAHAARTHTLDDGTPLPQASRVGVARVLGEHTTGPRGWIRRISSPVRFSTRREEA